jgi:hypothetical protein
VHGIGEVEVALLVQRHERHGGDRLRHRVDAPDGVLAHRRLALGVREAERAEVGDVPVAGDERLAAGDLARLDVPARQVRRDALEARLVESVGPDLHEGQSMPGAAGTCSWRRPLTSRLVARSDRR